MFISGPWPGNVGPCQQHSGVGAFISKMEICSQDMDRYHNILITYKQHRRWRLFPSQGFTALYRAGFQEALYGEVCLKRNARTWEVGQWRKGRPLWECEIKNETHTLGLKTQLCTCLTFSQQLLLIEHFGRLSVNSLLCIWPFFHPRSFS